MVRIHAGQPALRPPGFHGQRRSNTTHESTADCEARLLRKGQGQEAKLRLGRYALLGNRHSLCVQAEATSAVGVTETTAATELLARQLDWAGCPPQSVGAAKGCHNAELVSFSRAHGIAPHVAQIEDREVKGLDGCISGTPPPAVDSETAKTEPDTPPLEHGESQSGGHSCGSRSFFQNLPTALQPTRGSSL